MDADRYHVQVKIRDGYSNTFVWRRVRPTNGDPYVFTKEQAEQYIDVHGRQSGRPDIFRLEPLQ